MHDRYTSTIQFLFSQLPMYQRQGSVAFKKDLTNILHLTDKLGNPHLNFPSIHIAGTNGKGSIAHLLSAIFQSEGLKVGLYTSPHYRDFRERIKINGEYIREEAVVNFVASNKTLITEINPSFFEITVAMAFDYFSAQTVDLAIIETGLGGRLDSTNILSPIISVISNIDYDHQQFLGDTLPAIAGEKAGIIKKHTPVVIGETQEVTKNVFEAKAKKENAPIVFADRHYRITATTKNNNGQLLTIEKDGEVFVTDLELGLSGDFQQKNLLTVLQTIDIYTELSTRNAPITPANIREGVKHVRQLTRFFGRWQIIDRQPLTIVDSAHNQAGISEALNNLRSITYERLHIVLGVVNDKELEKTLPLFPKTAVYYFAKANIPRGLEADILQKKAADFQLKGKAYTSVASAYRAARETASRKDLVLVIGSVFVVAEVI